MNGLYSVPLYDIGIRSMGYGVSFNLWGKQYGVRMIFLLLIPYSLLLIPLAALGQTIPESDFAKSVIPMYSTDAWYTLSMSNNEFSVANKNGKLEITKVKQNDKCTLVMAKGNLYGWDGGEFGGKLTYKPADGSKPTVHIKDGNIKYIFSLNDSIYFIEGLAHLSTNEGAMYKLDTAGGKFTYSKILSFYDAPEAFAMYNDMLLIAGHQNFYIIHKNIMAEILLQNMFWRGLYPNSIAVIDDKHVYIGIRSGYVKLNLKNKEIVFYKYKK
jgi:hypothetical protein